MIEGDVGDNGNLVMDGQEQATKFDVVEAMLSDDGQKIVTRHDQMPWSIARLTPAGRKVVGL